MTSRSKRSKAITAPPTPLLCQIDWYSFTIPVAGGLKGDGNDTLNFLGNVLSGLFDNRLDRLEKDGTWRIVQAKGFYQFRATHIDSGVCVSWGEVNAHLFVELPGQACAWARFTGLFEQLVKATHDRASRVDCAIDILTSTKPVEFVSAGFAKRFAKNTIDGRSDTGDTFYVGSRKSDRFARVYRYDPPNPRSPYLRVETQFGGKSARSVAALLASDGALAAVAAAHRPFQWAHKEMTLDFLQLRVFELDRVINPATENISGWLQPFSRRCDVTTKRELSTLFAGLRKRSYRRLFNDRQRQLAIEY